MRGAFGTGEELLLGQGGEPAEGGADPGLVEGAAGQGPGRGEDPDPQLFPVGVDEDARCEGAQGQGPQARGAFELRVRGVEQLADPVEPEPVDGLGGHPPAGVVRGFQDGDRDSGGDQVLRCRES